MELAESQQRRRFVAFTVLLVGATAFLAAYLFWLQIVRGFEFKQRARNVSQREVTIPAQRGAIFDRSVDEPLAVNVDSFAVEISPGEIAPGEVAPLLSRLSAILGMTPDDLNRKVPPRAYGTFQPIELKSGLPLGTISFIAEHLSDFKGVSWRSKPIRKYAGSRSLAQVVGYVGDITREELEVQYNHGRSLGDVLGKSGVEKQYDGILRGRDGTKFRVVDVRERRLTAEGEGIVLPSPGKNLVLTIDRRIQKLAEEALGPRNGSVVVLKPATGEVLAMVSYPSFDPNKLLGPGGGEYFADLSGDPAFPFFNRAIQAVYPPASTFKVVMTAAIVDDGTIPIYKMLLCTGKLVFGDRVFNCWLKTGHGYVDLFRALAQSCDVYFWTRGNELGVDKIDAYAQDFGFGSLTGIDLPEEKPGLVPAPAWKEKIKHQKWVGGDTLNLAIGQGFITVSPLQMADMIAMVANSGVVYRPHLLKEVRDPLTGSVVSTFKPEVLHRSAISLSTWRAVAEAMRGVIAEGTAAPVITTRAVEIAGKTGTSETGIEGQWHSWFAAYGPYTTEKPEDQVVVVVMVEGSQKWEWWAPKAANLIFQGIFAHQTFDQAVAELKPWYAPPTGRVE